MNTFDDEAGAGSSASEDEDEGSDDRSNVSNLIANSQGSQASSVFEPYVSGAVDLDVSSSSSIHLSQQQHSSQNQELNHSRALNRMRKRRRIEDSPQTAVICASQFSEECEDVIAIQQHRRDMMGRVAEPVEGGVASNAAQVVEKLHFQGMETLYKNSADLIRVHLSLPDSILQTCAEELYQKFVVNLFADDSTTKSVVYNILGFDATHHVPDEQLNVRKMEFKGYIFAIYQRF